MSAEMVRMPVCPSWCREVHKRGGDSPTLGTFLHMRTSALEAVELVEVEQVEFVESGRREAAIVFLGAHGDGGTDGSSGA